MVSIRDPCPGIFGQALDFARRNQRRIVMQAQAHRTTIPFQVYMAQRFVIFEQGLQADEAAIFFRFDGGQQQRNIKF